MALGRRFEKLMHEGKDPFDDGVNSDKFRGVKGRKIKKVRIKADGTW